MYVYAEFYENDDKNCESKSHNAIVSSLMETMRVADGRIVLLVGQASEAEYLDLNNRIAIGV